jgi:hypothetical protein
MIQTYLPPRDADRLAAVLRDAARAYHHPLAALTPQLDYFEALLRVAEQGNEVPERLPPHLNRFPFSWSARLRNFFLRALRLVFREQREMNGLLIAALREAVTALRTVARFLPAPGDVADEPARSASDGASAPSLALRAGRNHHRTPNAERTPPCAS